MNDTMLNNEDIKSLINILNDNGKAQQAVQFTNLVQYVDTLEMQIGSVLKELQTLKSQLTQNPQQIAYPAAQDTAKGCIYKLHEQIQKMMPDISSIKEKITATTKNIVQDFKKKGIAALDKMVEFVGIKQSLTAINDSININILRVTKGIQKVNMVSQEFNAAMKHSQNVVRVIANKERLHDAKLPSKTLVKPLKAMKTALEKMRTVSTNAVAKLDQLTVSAATDEKKPSINASIQQHKENSKLPDQSMKTPKLEVAR